MPGVASIHRGVVSYSNADGLVPPPISLGGSVDTSKCLVLYCATSGTAFRDYRYFWGYTLTSSEISFHRFQSQYAAPIEITWEVVEFTDAVVHRGVAVLSSNPTLIAIPAVDVTRSVISIRGLKPELGQAPLFSAFFVDSSTIQIDQEFTTNSELHWQVVEFPVGGASVQSISVQNTGVTSYTVSISPVDQSRSVIANNGMYDGFNWVRDMHAWSFAGNDLINFEKSNLGSQVWINARAQVIEFDSASKRAGVASLAEGQASAVSNFGAVDGSTSFSFEMGMLDNVYQTDAVAPDPADIRMTRTLGPSFDTLTINRYTTLGAFDAHYQVLELTSPGAGPQTVSESISMGLSSSVNQGGLLSINDFADLSSVFSSAADAASKFRSLVGVGVSHSADNSEALTFGDVIAQSFDSGLSASGSCDVSSALSFSILAALSATSSQSVSESISVGVSSGLSVASAAQISASIFMGVGSGILANDAATRLIQENIGLAFNAQLASVPKLVVNDDLSIEIEHQIDVDGVGIVSSTVLIGGAFSLSLSEPRMSVLEALNLGAAIGLLTQDNAAQLSLPGGRALSVASSSREIQMEADQRTVSISVNSRIITP